MSLFYIFSKHNYLVLTQIHLSSPVFPHLKNGADLRPCFIKLLGILNMYTVSLVFEASYHKVMLFYLFTNYFFIYKLIQLTLCIWVVCYPYICAQHVCLVSIEARGEHQISWNWNYRWSVSCHVGPGTQTRGANAFNHLAISQIPSIYFLMSVSERLKSIR